jgi:GTP-binding protein
VISGKEHEPVEELIIDVPAEYGGAVISEIGKRKGILLSQEDNSDSTIRLIFEITTRGLLGLRSQLLTQSKGTVVMNSLFLRYQEMGSAIQKLRNGALISSDNGKAVAYGLGNAQERGVLFIEPQTPVYAGMIVGLHARANDLQVNVAKVKKLTNMRAAGADDAIMLTPPTVLTLEQSLDFLEDDELMEVTPKNIRLRKKSLDAKQRAKAKKESGS